MACRLLGYDPDPDTAVTDLEQAVINAVSAVPTSGYTRMTPLLYHLAQATRRSSEKGKRKQAVLLDQTLAYSKSIITDLTVSFYTH